MSAARGKYIVVTSFVWAAVLVCVIAYFKRPELMAAIHSRTPSGSTQPLAVGPSDPNSAAAQPVMPVEAPRAPVQLTPDQMQGIGMTTGVAVYKDLTDDLRATGIVAVNDRLISYAQVRFPGYIRNVFVNATYQYVKKEDPLFTIYSSDLVATQQEYIIANNNQRALASSTLKGVAAGARTLSTAAERRLEQWNISQDQVEALRNTGRVMNELTIHSPASGYVIERNAYPNMYAEPSTRLYAIADLSHIWVNAQVFQSDVGRLNPGNYAAINVDSYPQKRFRGRVEAILPQVDATTRTVQVRLSIENPEVLLKPGMFVNLDLKVPLGRKLVIPASALFHTGLKQIVFLDKGEGRIEPREVVTGPQVGNDIVVIAGVTPQESIVTSANFLIDSETQLQAANLGGAERAEPPAAQPERGAAQKTVQIECSLDPDPPQMGSNKIRVRLLGSGAAGPDGADVTVRFFMPAMPAMGMATMSSTAKLAAKGGGLYEGQADLSMGGTWQVTVTAKQGSQTIATKKFSVNAKGGM